MIAGVIDLLSRHKAGMCTLGRGLAELGRPVEGWVSCGSAPRSGRGGSQVQILPLRPMLSCFV